MVLRIGTTGAYKIEVKWDVSEVHLDRDPDLKVTDINWDNPWDIPDKAILTLSKQYEDHIILVRFCC